MALHHHSGGLFGDSFKHPIGLGVVGLMRFRFSILELLFPKKKKKAKNLFPIIKKAMGALRQRNVAFLFGPVVKFNIHSSGTN